MRVALEWQGYVVDTFDEPEIVFRQFSARKYDVVIIGARMKGFELASMIHDKDKGVKIILMGKPNFDKGFEKAGIATKIDVFMRQPRGVTKLVSHIEALLKQRKRELVSSITAAMVPIIAMSSETVSLL